MKKDTLRPTLRQRPAPSVCLWLVPLILCLWLTALPLPAQPSAPPNPVFKIPFTYDADTDPYILIQVSVNHHKPLPFIVDTGTDVPLTIEPWAVKRLGVRLSNLTTPLGPTKCSGAATPRAKIGRGYEDIRLIGANNWPVTKLQALVLDTSGVVETTDPIAGMIGLPMLQAMCLQIDFPRRRLLFCQDASRLPHPVGSAAFPLRLDADGDLDTVFMPFGSGNGVTRMFLDTGASGATLPDAIISRLRPQESFETEETTLMGATERTNWLIPSLPVGLLAAPNVSVYGSDLDHGTLGLSVLSRFIVTLDWPHKKILLALARRP